MEQQKEKILNALRIWINQRPGLEFGNYGDMTAYNAEMRSITKDRKEALQLLSAVRWRDSITADVLRAAFRDAFSGRLTLIEDEKGVRFDYCTGQYWPTEYRRAACAVLANALWQNVRPDIPNEGRDGQSPGDLIRAYFRREFGPTIQRRWLD